MKALIKDFFTAQVEKRGKMIIPHTPKDKVTSFIKTLYPYSTDKGLIRLGPVADGGYMVPDDLQGIEACFSPGVGPISVFEADCFKRGMKIFLADKSVEKPNQGGTSYEFTFLKKFLGCTNNDEYITLDEWVKTSGVPASADLLLQMDIESGEYNSLINATDEVLKRFRIMVIEFHKLQNLWEPPFFSMMETIFNKLLQTHTIVHHHPNNCCGIHDQFGVEIPRVTEFTFLRNDRIKSKSFQTQFPHPQDSDNTQKAHIDLPKNWYKSS